MKSNKESQPRKGSDKPLEIDIAHNCAPLHSATGPSHPMPIYTAGSDYE